MHLLYKAQNQIMIKTNLISILLLLLTFGILSCSNDDDLEEPDFISATINEEDWSGNPEITLNQENDTLTILGLGDEQVVVFKIKFNGEGVYSLSDAQANYYTTVGGDVITSLYALDPDSSSQITVTEYNSEQKIVKGSFELSLLQEWSNPENNINLLSFTNGQFKGTITN